MDDTVPFGMGMKLASLKGAGEGGRGNVFRELVGVFIAYVEVQCLFLEKGFVAIGAIMGLRLLVLFHVIVHGVLAVFCDTAGGTNKLSIFRSEIGKRSGRGGRSGRSGSGGKRSGR